MTIRQLCTALLALVFLTLAAPASGATPIEDYASYQPQTKCSPKAKPGTTYLGHWLVRKYGGGFGPISRGCGGGASEHAEGRAFDWTLDATVKADRKSAKVFMERALRTDGQGNTSAWARRMGIMYLIWDDEMYSAWDHFDPEPYLSSSCTSRRKCSATLRHRNHLHISLTRAGGRGSTSWYDGRL
jgi:hypothetical protein